MRLIGQTFGKYRISEHLGSGGMSEVYKAYQPGLDRYVAIKVLHSFLAQASGSPWMEVQLGLSTEVRSRRLASR